MCTLIYAPRMGKVNISVARVQARLDELGKERSWLEEQLEIDKNMITNWKQRGIPAAYAVDLARILGVTTDWLFERSESAGSNAAPASAVYDGALGIDAMFIGEMVSVYCVADAEWQDGIRDAVRAARENLSPTARNKLKNRR